MSRRAIGSALLLVAAGACSVSPENSPESKSPGDVVKVLLAQDADRVYVSVVNVANFNFRWDTYPRAEQTGDVRFDFRRNGVQSPSVLRPAEIASAAGLVWLQSADGAAFARRKALLVERFDLKPGCYALIVHVTNSAAESAGNKFLGIPGPVVEARSAPVEVCF